MSVQSLVQGVWSLGLALQALLAIALIAKKAWRSFPTFTAYALVNLSESVLLFVLVKHQEVYFYGYVVGETITIVLGLAVVFEIFNHIISPYPGLRRVSRVSLFVVLTLLVALAGSVIYAHAPIGKNGVFQAVVLMEEAARVLEVGLITFLFVCSSLFGLHARQSVFGITLGLGIFTMVKLLALVIAPRVGLLAAGYLSLAYLLAFDCSMLVWLGYTLAPERVTSTAEMPKRAQLEQWNQAIMELINQ